MIFDWCQYNYNMWKYKSSEKTWKAWGKLKVHVAIQSFAHFRKTTVNVPSAQYVKKG